MPARTGWSKTAPNERRMIINNAFAMRPQFTEIWQTFDEIRADFREGAPATCMIIIGETGVGKSTVVEEYSKANLPTRNESEHSFDTKTPVLLVSLKGMSQRLSAAQTILKKLQRLPTVTGKLSPVTDRIEAQMKKQAVELLILDEFQHLAETGAEKTKSQTADWIKGLAKETRVPIVLVGMPSLADVITANAQLASITPLRRALAEFRYDNERRRKAFRSFLSELDALFPFDQQAGLGEDWLAEKMFLASGGNPRLLCTLLRWAAKAAIEDGSRRILEKHLETAYDKFGGLSGLVDENPFARSTLLKQAS